MINKRTFCHFSFVMEGHEGEESPNENPADSQPQEPSGEEEQQPEAPVEPEIPPPAIPPSTDVNFKDPVFPYSPNFSSLSRKEKEALFQRAFEEQTLFIRNKELKCVNSPISPLLDEQSAQKIVDMRQMYFESYENAESRKAITRKITEATSQPAPRVDVDNEPTFNSLLNVNFESQFSLIDKFKTLLSQIITRNRAEKRTRDLTQYLINQTTNVVKSLQDKAIEEAQLSANSLLTLNIVCCRDEQKFAEKYKMEEPLLPEPNIEVHNVEKPFEYYTPGLVERYQLTPFARTDITSYVATPITPPETFPVVNEELPIRERIIPSIDITEEMKKEVINQEVAPTITAGPLPLPKVIQYPREVRYYDFDPAYELRPQPIQLPDLDNEIGKASILALPLSEYEKLSFNGKTNAPYAPFEFSGITKFMESGLTPMSGPDPVDLRELEADDDIDGIDITPKVRPVTDFISKPLSTKNKSHSIQEAVAEGQQQWKERQKKGVAELVEKLKYLNSLMRDKNLNLPMDDLLEYIKE